ncbi:aspartate--tRNA ligase [Candidatus Nesciobacter abundans]|uniref:Aspartate--tRNA(Asp/Asn) ligase n=1 Tax=Candidatus Nesciobacter abundans TaxID=2601668 RepID=A0A5C0UHP1_9PROT|nr:aspartate--tRNA ligase [Candidatus Nesciobacter abundans]QEK39073.1 aspartate--tRNA ligase [Candidatus Nesciobacter abundans]
MVKSNKSQIDEYISEFNLDYNKRVLSSSMTKDKINKNISISGWLAKKRDHGNMIFIDVRDHKGIIQCIIDKNHEKFEEIEKLNVESVIWINGLATARPKESINEKIDSGYIEIKVDSFVILSKSETLPFALHQEDIGEEIRLKHRYIDLRREDLKNRIILRSNVISEMRSALEEKGFIEIHTPILTSSSPEGARDYLVPSRANKGKFYALPQAPQQFKQLLMVGGFNKYYQVAPCFRDEDSRADRTPGAFYQLDLEMSFVSQEDIFEIMEGLLYRIFSKFRSDVFSSKPPFKRIKYQDSLMLYGTDKPDLRIDLQYLDFTEFFVENTPKIFEQVLQDGGKILCLPVNNLSSKSRKFFDGMNDFARELGAKGLGYICLSPEKKGSMSKFLSDEVCNKIKEKADGAFFLAGKFSEIVKCMDPIIKKISKEMDLIKKDRYEFCWIIDYPMYEMDDNGKWDFSHNPFSMPQGGMSAFDLDPSEIKAYQYDIVCNGIELSSGAIRNHDLDIMYKAFDVAGYTKSEVDEKFSAITEAFKYGAPPHGGSAPGIDRIVMLLSDMQNIREVIPFPLNQSGQDLMMNAPSEIEESQLKDLGLQSIKED